MREKISKPKKFRQNTEEKRHFHPRILARGIVHRQMERQEMTGVNKVKPGATQSPFALNWRNYAEAFANERR